MPITLGSNIASLQAQRRLGQNSQQLSNVFERLSSGQRINTASDDAAGLAIADELRSDSRVLSVATRNINDGISMLNILSSTLSEQKSILTRLSELAEQGANGVYSREQRDAMNEEYQALVQEFGRIAEATEFNGQNLLLGGRGDYEENFAIQAGITGALSSIINLMVGDSGPYSGSLYYTNDFYDSGAGTAGADGVYNLDDLNYLALFRSTDHTFEELADFANQSLFQVTVTDSNGEERQLYGTVWVSADENSPVIELWEEIGDGTYRAVQGAAGGSLESYGSDFANLNLTFDDGSTGSVSLDLRGLDFNYGVGNSGADSQSSINFTGVETADRSLTALTRVGNRLQELSKIEGRLGAVQSRLETARNVVEVSRENALSAESRIRDADIAQESSDLTRLGILQQASAAVLAQANQQPALALQLLT